MTTALSCLSPLLSKRKKQKGKKKEEENKTKQNKTMWRPMTYKFNLDIHLKS